MITYRKGSEIVTQLGDSTKEFWLNHGYEIVEPEDGPPADMGEAARDIEEDVIGPVIPKRAKKEA